MATPTMVMTPTVRAKPLRQRETSGLTVGARGRPYSSGLSTCGRTKTTCVPPTPLGS